MARSGLHLPEPVDLPADGRVFTLRDQTRALVRPIRPADGPELQRGLAAMSESSRYARFGTVPQRLSARELRYLTEVDQRQHIALIAFDLTDDPPRGVATVRCVRVPGEPEVAELAVTVVDSHQGRGLGTLLLALLVAAARTQGIERLRSYVLATNVRMLEILDQLGSRRCGMDGSLCCVDTPLRAAAELPDTQAGRVFRELASRLGPPPAG
jgi:RimJ/RimL family protein N-acetyltransferase